MDTQGLHATSGFEQPDVADLPGEFPLVTPPPVKDTSRGGLLTRLRTRLSIREAESSPVLQHREALYRRLLATSDALAALSTLFFAAFLADANPDLAGIVLAIPAVILFSKLNGLYDRDEVVLNKTTMDEIPSLFQVATLFALGIWLGEEFILGEPLNRGPFLATWAAGFLLLIAGRVAARHLAKRLGSEERCLLIGDGDACERVRVKLEHPHYHAKVVASVSLDEAPQEGNPLRDLADLRALAETDDIHRVIIAPGSEASQAVLDVVRAAKDVGLRVSIVPRPLELVGSAVEFDDLGGLTVLGVKRFGLTRSSTLVKRGFDLVVSGLGFLVTAPLMAVVAIAVKLDSPGPVFFRQTRVGRGGRHFQMIKFRTMVQDADQQKAELHPLNEADGLFKIAADPRITRVGRFLRKMSLDELPQLFNVLRGEMSLVGPRPLIVEEDSRIEGWHRRRLQLTPGMTGQWQILGSARVPLHEMVKIDYLYVATWSLWRDVKILLRTLPYVLARRGL